MLFVVGLSTKPRACFRQRIAKINGAMRMHTLCCVLLRMSRTFVYRYQKFLCCHFRRVLACNHKRNQRTQYHSTHTTGKNPRQKWIEGKRKHSERGGEVDSTNPVLDSVPKGLVQELVHLHVVFAPFQNSFDSGARIIHARAQNTHV